MNDSFTSKRNPVIFCGSQHADATLAILNDAILHSTALYDYKPRTPPMMSAWFEAKVNSGYPVIGIENDDCVLMGFASYGPFRAWPAYKYSIEHSVYVDARYRGQGIGRRLLSTLITEATAKDYHMMIGGIDAANTASIALHQKLGFTHCASIKQAGFKFGRWLDLEFYQLILMTPKCPSDE